MELASLQQYSRFTLGETHNIRIVFTRVHIISLYVILAQGIVYYTHK